MNPNKIIQAINNLGTNAAEIIDLLRKVQRDTHAIAAELVTLNEQIADVTSQDDHMVRVLEFKP